MEELMKDLETHTHCKRISDETLMIMRMTKANNGCFYSAGEKYKDEAFPCDHCGYKIEEEEDE